MVGAESSQRVANVEGTLAQIEHGRKNMNLGAHVPIILIEDTASKPFGVEEGQEMRSNTRRDAEQTNVDVTHHLRIRIPFGETNRLTAFSIQNKQVNVIAPVRMATGISIVESPTGLYAPSRIPHWVVRIENSKVVVNSVHEKPQQFEHDLHP